MCLVIPIAIEFGSFSFGFYIIPKFVLFKNV